MNGSVISVSSDIPLDFAVVGNGSTNSSSESCAIAGKPVGTKELKIAIHLITLVVALVGNSLLMAAFVRMKEPLMLLIANMAGSDIFTAIFLIPRLLTIEITGSYAFQMQGLGGTILCKMCTFLSDISVSVSTQSLVIIAVERFLAVVYPLKTRRITVKTRRVFIASTWVIAMVFHSPYLYTFELVKNENNETICSQSKWFADDPKLLYRYNVFLYFTIFFIPMVAVSILYPIIFIKLRMDKMSAHRSIKGEDRSRRRNINLLKLAVATALALLISWTSYVTIFFLDLFAPDTLPKCSYIFNVVYFAAIVLASSYCATNPIICFMFLRNFRAQLLIMCKLKRRATLNFDDKISRRSRASTANTSCRVELVQATPKPETSIQDTTG